MPSRIKTMNQKMNVTLYLPSGLVRTEYDQAIKTIKAETKATKIRRWSERGIQHEDFQDDKGNVVAQIETSGYPLMNQGFEYVDR